LLQELWALEKQRADLASETERVKQDNEFMEGEITTLRATVTEQMQQVTALKVSGSNKGRVGMPAVQGRVACRVKAASQSVQCQQQITTGHLLACSLTAHMLLRQVCSPVDADKTRCLQHSHPVPTCLLILHPDPVITTYTPSSHAQEELATRKADVAHLKQLSGDQKGQIEHLKRSLDSANGQLRETQQALNQTRSDKAHFEREADRLQEESSRLSTEFNKTSKVGEGMEIEGGQVCVPN
jgi:DNA repair exonuclease SbcCD ATPase subunit